MTLRLADAWLWDSWYVVDRDEHHVFFLRASRALLDPRLRHDRATVGHAVSRDLRNWTLLADAFVPADEPAWDDLAIWTGSVVRDPEGRWHFLYTGTSRAHGGSVQRIGRAVSDDLVTWHRAGPDPVAVADPQWYETRTTDGAGRETWRDPWVFADPLGDGWHMLVTARSNAGDPRWRGVIGHARSPDLTVWTVGPPLSTPAGFVDLEVPQVAEIGGRPVLVFSCGADDVASHRQPTRPSGSVWSVNSATVMGPFDLEKATPFAHPSLYAGRLVVDPDVGWSLIGFRDVENGTFAGELVDPIPVHLSPTAGLVGATPDRAMMPS